VCSDIRAIRPRIPREIGIDITGILDLAHAGATTTDSATEVRTAATAVHHVDNEGGDESGPAEPEEGAGGLCLAAVLLGVCGAIADAVGEGVALLSVRKLLSNRRIDRETYPVRAAVSTKVCGKRDGSAEAEQHAQSIHGDVDNGDAELLDEGCGQEVQQGEEPPHADEERVVDNRVCAMCRAIDVVGHEGSNEDGADELCMLDMLVAYASLSTYLPGTEAHREYSGHHIENM
jgi:hypothetical protein